MPKQNKLKERKDERKMREREGRRETETESDTKTNCLGTSKQRLKSFQRKNIN